MTIKDFIEKAIEGGWKGTGYIRMLRGMKTTPDFFVTDCEINGIILDPLAWIAVSKVEEWRTRKCEKEICIPCNDWKYAMHRMIDALCDDKTIEQYLETL